jgi:cell division protein FtsZ
VNVTGGSDFSLSEYEEILQIITANSDEDALVIAGTGVDDALEDEIAVTVIATGFAPGLGRNVSNTSLYKSSSSEDTSKKSEYISLDTWNKMTGKNRATAVEDTGHTNPSPAQRRDPVVTRFSSDDLGVPAYLRMKQKNSEKDK